jgi:hypothetical protein
MASKRPDDGQINQIQRDVGEIKVSIARVEENIKTGIINDDNIDKKFQTLEERHKEFNQRITKLEEWQWRAIGIGATLFTIISVATQYFLK